MGDVVDDLLLGVSFVTLGLQSCVMILDNHADMWSSAWSVGLPYLLPFPHEMRDLCCSVST